MKLTASGRTYKIYWRILENFFGRFRDRHLAEEFHRYDISDFKEMRLREGKAPRTVALELAVLKAFWNWLIERELATYNPVVHQKFPKIPESRPRGLDRATVDKLLKECISLRDKLIVLMGITTGMRGNELARLQWTDIDWENNLIHLTGDQTKSRKGRSLPLRADVKALLEQFHDGRTKSVFGSKAGSPRRLWHAFNNIVKRAEIYPRPTFHSLRHTFASMMLMTGLDIYTVQKLMGHANITTTSIYLTPASNEDVRKKLELLPA